MGRRRAIRGAMYDRFFGYGSLVNAATHEFEGLSPARLRGWRRTWVLTSARPVSYLSVTSDPSGVIDGAVAAVPAGGWAALDLREAAYERHCVAGAVDPAAPGICVYAVPDAGRRGGPGGILMSYLVTVVQGFRKLHGAGAALRFFETTDGWDAPLIEDLDAPVYSRTPRLHAADVELTRQGLSRVLSGAGAGAT